MGIIKWFNDKFSKSAEAEVKPQEDSKCPDCGADAGHFSTCTGSMLKPRDVVLSDEDRIVNYVADGGEVVDLSNKPRLPYDGFASDGELMQPFNQAHTGTKAGLSSLMKGKR